MAARWEVKKVLEIPGCLQWLWDGALPMRPTDRGKRPYASTRGPWTVVMGKLKISFKPQCRHNQNLCAALSGYQVLIFFPQPGSGPAQGLSPRGCTQHMEPGGRGCPVRNWTPEGQEQPSGSVLTHSAGLAQGAVPRRPHCCSLAKG